VSCQPSAGVCQLAVGKQADRLTPLEIADDRAVAVVAPPGPVVDPDYMGAAKLGQSCFRTTLRSVPLLIGVIKRSAKRAAGRPPRARPRWNTSRSSRAVRRADGNTTSSSKRSANITRLHTFAPHRKRRANSTRRTGRPARGRSPMQCRYRLSTRDAGLPHSGQTLVRPAGRTTISIPALVLSIRSSTKPDGTSAAAQIRWLMMLISNENPPFMVCKFIKIESEPTLHADSQS